jgi:hypothetical protein
MFPLQARVAALQERLAEEIEELSKGEELAMVGPLRD